MRRTLLVTSLVVGWAAPGLAQAPSRLTLGPVAQVVHASFDGHTRGTLTVAGVAAAARVSRALWIEGELTSPGRAIARSYEGAFISYVPGTPASPTLAELERWAPRARRTLTFDAGIGGAAMLVARALAHRRVSVAGRLGISARGYTERSHYQVLAIPAGVDPARVARDFADEAIARVRGGLLVGGSAEFALTRRFAITPQTATASAAWPATPASSGRTSVRSGMWPVAGKSSPAAVPARRVSSGCSSGPTGR